MYGHGKTEAVQIDEDLVIEKVSSIFKESFGWIEQFDGNVF